MWTLFIECRMCDTAVTQCEGDVRETEINLGGQRLRDLVPYFIFPLCCPNSKEIKSDCIPLPEALRALALARYSLICVARPIESCRRIESPFKRTRNLPYIYIDPFLSAHPYASKRKGKLTPESTVLIRWTSNVSLPSCSIVNIEMGRRISWSNRDIIYIYIYIYQNACVHPIACQHPYMHIYTRAPVLHYVHCFPHLIVSTTGSISQGPLFFAYDLRSLPIGGLRDSLHPLRSACGNRFFF